MKKTKKKYDAPEVIPMECKVEKGFAGSTAIGQVETFNYGEGINF